MSAISTLLTRLQNTLSTLRAAIWAIDVRDDIADAIEECGQMVEQCYSDVSNPTLQTEALEAALQNKIDQGEMAALTIGDRTITAVKLANGVIPAADATLTTSGGYADAAETGRQIGNIKAELSSFKAAGGADKYFKNVKVYGSPASIGITNIRNNYGSADAKQTGFAIFPTTTDTEWGSAIKNLSNIPVSGHYKETLSDGRTYEFDYDLSSLASGTRDIVRDPAHIIKQSCFYDDSTLTEVTEDAYGTVKYRNYTPIQFSLSSQSTTQSGITWTQNSDGTIRVQGTATATVIISPQSSGGALTFSLSAGKAYRLRGCPVSGGNETYRLEVRDSLSSGTTLCIDTGNGVVFTVPGSGSYYPIIRIASGQTVDLIFAIEIAEQATTEEPNALTAVDLVARAIGRKNDVYFSLASDLIPGTTQTYVLSDGVVSQIIHKKSGITIRTDTYTYGTSTIIEVRSLSTGESLTITTNLETLATSIAYNEI